MLAEIVFEKISESVNKAIGKEPILFSMDDSPAYGIFLRLKSNPNNKYQIQQWLRPDLDAKKQEFELLLNQMPGFVRNLEKGIKALK